MSTSVTTGCSAAGEENMRGGRGSGIPSRGPQVETARPCPSPRCFKWRMISYDAVCSLKDSGGEAEWTCSQLGPPGSSCATPQSKLEEQGVRYATTGMGDLWWERRQQRLGLAVRGDTAASEGAGKEELLRPACGAVVPPGAAADKEQEGQAATSRQQQEEVEEEEEAPAAPAAPSEAAGAMVVAAGPQLPPALLEGRLQQLQDQQEEQYGSGVVRSISLGLIPEGAGAAFELGAEEGSCMQLMESVRAAGVAAAGAAAHLEEDGPAPTPMLLPGLGPAPPGPQGPHQEGAWGPLEFARQVSAGGGRAANHGGRGQFPSLTKANASPPCTHAQARILASRCHVGGMEDAGSAPQAGPCPGGALLPSSSPLLGLAAMQVACQSASDLAKKQVWQT